MSQHTQSGTTLFHVPEAGDAAPRDCRRRPVDFDAGDLDSALQRARDAFAAGRYPETFDIFDRLYREHPQHQQQLLCLAHSYFRQIEHLDRYSLYQSRFYDFGIQPGSRVLDIGSGNIPFLHATDLADLALHDGSVGRAGVPFKHIEGKPVYECNIEAMPFADQEFDFIYCSHLLEHVDDPERACAELMRVGKRGFIETPTRGKDQWLNTAAVSNHRWWVELWDDTLIFTEYSPDELRGFDSNVLLNMHCSPQSEREKAFSALLYLKSDLVNVMHYWEGEIRCQVRRGPGRLPARRTAPAARPAGGKPTPPAPAAGSAPAGPNPDSAGSDAPRCLFINTYYEGFLQAFYASTGSAGLGYSEQKALLEAECFGDSDFYSQGLINQGWLADDLIVNAGPLQAAWAREHGCSGTGLAIALEQVRRMRPDVVYLQDLSLASRQFIEELRPLTTLIVAQIASPVPEGAHLAGIDVVVSSFPHFVERFRAAGITAYYQPLAFDPRVLERSPAGPRDIDASFVGGVSPHHGKGLETLEKVACATSVDFWGYGAHFLSPDSPIAARHHGEAWGREMFTLLRRSRITLNRHIDVAEDAANNMRLFEATGCGALLITDYKDNLNELFEIGTEVVAYRTPEECAALVDYYRTHPEEADAIARAGQQRTLREHSYAARMEHTSRFLKLQLRRRREAGRHGGVDAAGISCGHTPIQPSEVTSQHLSAWKADSIPARQRALVAHELGEMYRGAGPIIFRILAGMLRQHLPAGAPVLEIGCASGYYLEILEYLLNRRLDYTGVDYSEAMIAMAKDYYPQATFFAADGACLCFADRSFHTVISSCVLLHVTNYREHILESARVAERFIIASRTPVCRQRPTQYLKKFAYGVETVELIFNEGELVREFAMNGFQLLERVQYHADEARDEYQATYLFTRN